MGGRLSRHYGPSRDEETKSLLLGEHHFYMQDIQDLYEFLPRGEPIAYYILNEQTGKLKCYPQKN